MRWDRQDGFLHQKVDDGERGVYNHKETPILLPDGVFPAKKISRLFMDASRDMDQRIADLVYRKLGEYPE